MGGRAAPGSPAGSAGRDRGSAEPGLDLRELRALLELLREYDLTELEVERGGARIRLRRDRARPPAAAAAGAGPGPVAAREERSESLVTIEAPMVGTLYRAPSPEAEPYVREGDLIKEGQVLCIIEAMKLMNEIESKVTGRVVRVLVENGQPVEYGQPLFLVEPRR